MRDLEALRARGRTNGVSRQPLRLGRGDGTKRTALATLGGDDTLRIRARESSTCVRRLRHLVVEFGGWVQPGDGYPKGHQNGNEGLEKAHELGNSFPGEDADFSAQGRTRLQLIWHRGLPRGDEHPSPRGDGHGAA